VRSNLVVSLVVAFALQGSASSLFSQTPAQDSSSQPAATTTFTQPASSKTVPPGFQERYPRYQLVPGDTMDLVFEFSPEFNQTVTIQPDGYISLRGVSDVHVSSDTLPQLIARLQDAYGKILNKPAISVVMKDFDKPSFTASGMVGKPGKYTLHGEMTVTEGIALAGGFTEKSKHSQVVLFRRVSDQWTEAKVLDVKKMLASKNLSEDFELRPGDMIFVPQNTMSKISRYLPTTAVNTYLTPQTFF